MTSRRFMIKFAKLLVALLISLQVNAYIGNEVIPECKARLKSAYEQEGKYFIDVLSNGKCWVLEYSSKINVWDPYEQKFVLHTDGGILMATQNIRYTKSTTTEILSDKIQTFTIDHDSKNIFKIQTDERMFNIQKNMFSRIFDDSTLRNYKIVSCDNIKYKGSTAIKYVILPINNQAEYERMEVYIDTDKGLLLRTTGQGTGRINSVRSFDFEVISRKSIVLDESWKDVESRVLTKEGKLIRKYSGYKYKDLKK